MLNLNNFLITKPIQDPKESLDGARQDLKTLFLGVKLYRSDSQESRSDFLKFTFYYYNYWHLHRPDIGSKGTP